IVEKTFREDLFYRLNVITIQLPPLRERKEDIVPLAEFLLRKHAVAGKPVTLSAELKHAFTTYHWPGNVRELENVVRKLTVLRNPDLIARELQSKLARKPAASAPHANQAPDHTPAVPEFAAAPILEQVTLAKQQAEIEA